MKNKRKENIKKTITKSKTLRIASSISKIKVRYNYHPSIGDYKEPFNESKMRLKINEILNSFSSYNDKSKSTAAKLIKEENLKNAKENIIISLREDLEYHKKINRHYLLYKQYATDISNYYKQNFDEIFKFKADLRSDLSDFIKIVEEYEEKIKKYNKEKDTMVKTNNDIMRYKNNEREKLNETINKLNNDLEKQKNKLDKINETLNEFKEQNETYLDKLNNNELEYLTQYENLNNKYQKLKMQYDLYFNMEIKKRKLELDYNNTNLFKEEKDNVNLKLQDKLCQNNFLKEIANEIKKQINEIESINHKSAEDEQLIKFLGKVFYNKVKQRQEEKEKEKNKIEKNKSNKKLKKAKSKSKELNKSKSRIKMKKKFGLNLIMTPIEFKNKKKINLANSNYNTGGNANIYNNHLKETCTNFSSYKNTKNNKFNSTSSSS